MSGNRSTARSICIATVVSAPDHDRLLACLDSVEHQTSPAWQHVVVVDDGTPSRRIRKLLHQRANHDDRVVVVEHPGGDEVDGGPAVTAYDAALAATDAPLFLLLGQHDTLAPEAVGELSAACAGDEVVVYGDHATVDRESGLEQPYFKPDFSPELLRNTSYIHRPLVAPTELVRAIGGVRDGFEGALDHDLALRLTETADEVVHVPQVLYRQEGAACGRLPQPEPRRSSDAGHRAVAEHCARVGVNATVDRTEHDGCYRLLRVPAARPLVSVVIPTRGSTGSVWGVSRTFATAAVESIAAQSAYQHLEFVVVFDEVSPPSALASIQRAAGDRPVQFVPFGDDFNFSAKINLGAAAATGEHLLLLNDDTELIDPDSIAVMVAHLDADDVGMVGAKLLFSDGTLQHGGHVYNRTVGHACTGWPGDSAGPWPLRPLAVEREVSGVTAAAALVRRDVFDEVGGFADDLPLNYNDVDFSLKVRAAGRRIIWTPHASWYHFESRTRRSELLPEETSFLNNRWGHEINSDPYCNPNIQLDRHDWFERPQRSPLDRDLYRLRS